MRERTASGWAALKASIRRERRVVMASRVAWAYGIVCLLWGASSPLLGVGRAGTAVWFLLPVLLYAIPLVALVAGVVAWHGDAGEDELMRTRIPGSLIRLVAKWLSWSALLAAATLLMVLPLLVTSVSPADLFVVWFYAAGEIAVFVAAGLAVGRYCRDPLLAHSGALLLGFLLVAGGGMLAYVAAWQPLMQRFPGLWTFLLMAHPVEALRVGVVYSVENLPFDPRQLPPLAAAWLSHAGCWYALLALLWSGAGLAVATLRR